MDHRRWILPLLGALLGGGGSRSDDRDHTVVAWEGVFPVRKGASQTEPVCREGWAVERPDHPLYVQFGGTEDTA